ncbi:TPA: exodeoxyribonuclease VII large subunit [Candidatus Ventrenecus stercoripullorum]|nr:exodeoxyribonuclease VII large subunit [Candidatus Ventrenecus stercoripullorum]
MNHEYITISKINQYIKLMFDSDNALQRVYLKGEISNFKRHTSGHLYLTLKDEESRISAIMFRSAAAHLTFQPEDGMNVLVTGRISVYPAGGNYQIYIDKMEVDGLGNLYVEFEKLKKKLQQEGLFDSAHKKEIPKFPRKIGIVTAPTGAAIKDILSTIQRRFPLCETILFPALVQGVSAASDVARKIEIANTYDIDVLIVGRGGGSIEDLWAFNEEIVARAIYNSHIPVISAVGHEVDITIADFVADRRAPTPTGAAEMAVPTVSEVKNIFALKKNTLSSIIKEKLTVASQELKKVKSSYILKNPMTLYEMKMQKLDALTDALNKDMTNYITQKKLELQSYQKSFVLQNPLNSYTKYFKDLENNQKVLKNKIEQILEKKTSDLQYVIQTLRLVNPLNILDKGFSLVKKDGHIIKSSQEIKEKDLLDIRLHQGELKVEVKEILS